MDGLCMTHRNSLFSPQHIHHRQTKQYTTPTMSELRQRPVALQRGHDSQPEASAQRHRGSSSASSASSASSKSERDNDEDPGISLLDLIRVALALVVASCGLSYYMTSGESMLWGYRPWYTRWPVVVRWAVSHLFFSSSFHSIFFDYRLTLAMQHQSAALYLLRPPNSPSTTAPTAPSPSTLPSTGPFSTSPRTRSSTGPAGATVSSPGATPHARS